MAFLSQRMIQSALQLPATIRATQEHTEPDVVILPVREGCVPSGKPAVRIFLGTEAAQYKAERVFIWSIEQVRDPARVYEIHLMKQLCGFRSRFWLTGFTNYRFAIPHFAGKAGRAIYNDVDQVYLRDPAEIFDLEMDARGYLAINAGDISVALFDCERMSRVWTLEDAQTVRKNKLLARANAVPGLWGELTGYWNARDREYVPEECGVLHYTALHRQPWHPLPKLFVYQANPAANVWLDLEQSANEAGFQVFSAQRPSREFQVLRRAMQDWPGVGPRGEDGRLCSTVAEAGELAGLLRECRSRTVLDCHLGAIGEDKSALVTEVAGADIDRVVSFDPLATAKAVPATVACDAVVCRDLLEFVPDDDIPWLLGQLFGRARRLLYCYINEHAEARGRADVSGFRRRNRNAAWWQYQFELVARQHPAVRWQVCLPEYEGLFRHQPLIIEGNECNDGDAVVWVLANSKPGHTSQATAIADTIGWPYQVMRVPQRLKALLLVLLHLNLGHVQPLRQPWPNVIVACGWWPTRVARWIKKRSGGRVRLLLAGRKCGPVKSPTDILISCEHFHLPIHERRIETLLPIHPVTNARLDAARQRGLQIIGAATEPRVALLVGGSSKQHVLTPGETELLGRRVLMQAQAAGGSLFAVTSRRTGNKQARALARSLHGGATVHIWSPNEVDNPYLNYLAAADILVVTGESESMLMDAMATGKPVYIYPLRQRRYGPWLSLGARLAQWSERRPKNRRGTERPQQGFEYLCSRILKREWILPPRDIDGLHRRLVAAGLARMFGDSLTVTPGVTTPVRNDLGRQLRRMLAQPQAEAETQECESLSLDRTARA